jgi:hypothetical protein
MMPSVLPACIRVNARPFTVRQFGALMLDELDEMAHEGASLKLSGTPPEAWPHRVWWASISEAERAEWRLWLRKDIQEVGPALRRQK